MITINLLPKEFRRSEKKQIVLPYKTLLVLVVLVLIFLHLTSFVLAFFNKIQIAHLQNCWEKVEPESKDAAVMREEIKKLEAELALVKAIYSRRVSLTQFFTVINLAFQRGLWLERFSFSYDEGLVLQGSVVSLSQSEMTIIGKFLQKLKADRAYAGALLGIELSSVQRRKVKDYDVVDFVLLGGMRK
jgi:hypothetical protein